MISDSRIEEGTARSSVRGDVRSEIPVANADVAMSPLPAPSTSPYIGNYR